VTCQLRHAKILSPRDGKPATVALGGYGDASAIRTNGSRGRINRPAPLGRGSAQVTMVRTGAMPIALKPQGRTRR